MRAGEADAWQALDQARLTLDHRGHQTPCAGRWHEFCAEDTATLHEAAQLCSECPIRDACGGVVPFVAHGAWAGRVVLAGKDITDKETA